MRKEREYERYAAQRRPSYERGARTYGRQKGTGRDEEEKTPMSFAKKTAVRVAVCAVIFLLALALKNSASPAAQNLRETISETIGATATAEDVEVFARGVSTRIEDLTKTTVEVFSGGTGAPGEAPAEDETAPAPDAAVEEEPPAAASADAPADAGETYGAIQSAPDGPLKLSAVSYTEKIEPISNVQLFGAATEAYDCDAGEAREDLPKNVCDDNLILPIKLAVPVDRHVTSGFGPRVNPVTKKESFHYGIDIGAPEGYPVVAPADGVAAKVAKGEAYGNNLTLHHDYGIGTFYGHLSEILVSEGESVSAGQVVARVGSTGWSTGPHLHFELHKDMMILNPENYFELKYD
ncbi:MAG: M23 family metallopeptidase [Clostridia bacterium]|nr:M23 family metallopeptidase [Clostridia bacterium]